MAQSRQPLFLARASYRKRRLRDGARLLPIFGFLLLVVPLLWMPAAQNIARHWGFVFVIWAGLIGVAAALSRGLADAETQSEAADVLPPTIPPITPSPTFSPEGP